MTDIIVVGGGISGLATAWFLHQAGRDVRILESGPEVGGSIRSLRQDGFLIEAGPNSTLARGGALEALINDLELSDELLEANRAASRRYVVKEDRPEPLPMGPGAFLRTRLFSARGKLRLLLEPFKRRAQDEESVAGFVRRRLGQEFLDWAIDPFVSGVYAGNPEQLSARAATARVYALERDYGSLFIGALARMLRRRASGPTPRGRLVSFREGMQTLPRAIADAMGERVLRGSEAQSLAQGQQGWEVRTADSQHTAGQVVLAVPAYRAAELLRPLDPDLADPMAAMDYPPVASIALGFPAERVRHPLDGFGMLIPSREGRRTLGVLFSSTLFPGRAPQGQVLLTAFIGGARNPGIAAEEANALTEAVMADLQPLLGLEGDPTLTRVSFWRRAIPQYTLGHLQRMARLDAALSRWPGLHLRANWRDGISVVDCVDNARGLAQRLAGQ